MPTRKTAILMAGCLGVLSTATQVMIIRELLVAFTGNELTVGTTLAFWLLSVAAGCVIFKRAPQVRGPKATGMLFVAGGVVAVLQVILIRVLDPLLLGFGEIAGPGVIATLSILGVAPCAVVLGGLFVLVVGMAERVGQTAPVSSAYGAETLGSGVAGAVLGLYLLERLNPVGTVTLASLIAVGCGLYLIKSAEPGRRLGSAVFAGLWLAALLTVLALSSDIDLATRRAQWRPLAVAETIDSRYGNIIVTDRQYAHDFFESGVLAFTIPDLSYAEECVHIPLLHHPNPERVLLIGGAATGAIPEIEKYSTVQHVDFVELDPAVIDVAARYAPESWLRGTRITVSPIYGDGRRYVAGRPEPYDVVIVNVGSPVSLQMNRYYTTEFFRQVDRILHRNGILALKFAAEGAYLSPEEAALLAAVINGCREVFGHVSMVPGGYIHVLTSPDLDIQARTAALPEILTRRRLATSYITPSILMDRLAPLRTAQLDSAVSRHGQGVGNTDSRPVSFSYAISLWAKHFRSGRIISAMVGWLDFRKSLIAFVVIGIGVIAVHMRVGGMAPVSLPAATSIYVMGFTTMFTEILIILVFQTISGYIYTRIAAIVAAFMLGMGLAASLMGRRSNRKSGWGANLRDLLVPQIGLAAMPAVVMAGLGLVKPLAESLSPGAVDIAFILTALVTGGLGGAVFAAASGMLAQRQPTAADAGALAYSLDLTGACVAGFMTGFLVIPSLGFAAAAYSVCTFGLVGLIPHAISRSVLRTAPPH